MSETEILELVTLNMQECNENRRKSISNMNKNIDEIEPFDNTNYLNLINAVSNLLNNE